MTNAEFDRDIFAHREYIYSIIYNKVKYNKYLAEDLTQNVLIKAYKYFQKYPLKKSTYKSLLYKISLHSVINYYRRNKDDKFSIDFTSFSENDTDDFFSPYEDFSNKFVDNLYLNDIINSGLEELKNKNPDHFSVLLDVVDGLEYHEISEKDSIPINTAKTRAHRARKFLQNYLESHNLSLSDL